VGLRHHVVRREEEEEEEDDGGGGELVCRYPGGQVMVPTEPCRGRSLMMMMNVPCRGQRAVGSLPRGMRMAVGPVDAWKREGGNTTEEMKKTKNTSKMVMAMRGRRGKDGRNATVVSSRRTDVDALMGYSASPNVSVSEDADLLAKIKAAWRIFFPEKKEKLSPKEEGKKRLRMILVADRCGMNSDSLVGMRESIVRAMSDFVEVEAEEAVEVNMSMDPDVGTIYSVAVPIKRVKPVFRPAAPTGARSQEVPGEGSFWDPTDPDSDPSDQFPYGT